MILPQSFYNRDTLRIAQDLLGCFLVRKYKGAFPDIRRQTPLIKYKIMETEAYCGPNDLASHASRGRTKRNEVMFGPPGRIYVYLCCLLYFINFLFLS